MYKKSAIKMPWCDGAKKESKAEEKEKDGDKAPPAKKAAGKAKGADSADPQEGGE